ncbi:MAG: hypothetical protein ACRDOB_15490 [Streptosporangiaceae bacterium]
MAGTEPSRQPLAANGDQRMAWLVVGLAASARLARDPRFQQGVIMLAIVLAAWTGVARNGKATSLARLVAWDRRQRERLERMGKDKVRRTLKAG